MSLKHRIVWPVGGGMAGATFLATLYLGIVSLAESPQHALELFCDDRLIVLPIVLGFGIQMSLYVILKKRLFVPVATIGPSSIVAGASGATSTVAMVACCLHHVTDVLPILGLTAATTFLAEYRIAFMLSGLSMTWIGVGVMLTILFRERRKALRVMQLAMEEA